MIVSDEFLKQRDTETFLAAFLLNLHTNTYVSEKLL